MTLQLLPDVEKLTITYLLTVEDLTDLVAEEIGSMKDPPYPRLVVMRVGGSAGSIPAYLDSARVQLEAWAPDDEDLEESGKSLASRIARTAQAAMYEMVNVAHDEAVVTDVSTVLGPLWMPDPVTSLPRYLVDFIVRARSLPSS